MNEFFEWFQGLADKGVGWIDKLFAYFDSYSGKWGKWILLIIGIGVASKIFKVRLDLKTGK